MYRNSLRYKLRRLNSSNSNDSTKTMVESKCPFVCLSHEMLLSQARSIVKTLHAEITKKSYWYQTYIKVKAEMKCHMPKSIMKNITADHFKALIMESTKIGEVNENSVLYYILHDTLKSLQHKPVGMRYSQAVLKWCVSLANKYIDMVRSPCEKLSHCLVGQHCSHTCDPVSLW